MPPSGSTFPIGETTVTCTATDDAGNSASANFTVTIIAPDTSGATLQRLELARNARGKKVTKIILTFNEEMNPVGAQAIEGNYELALLKKKPKPVALRSAAYAERTVTLSPSKPIVVKSLSKLRLTIQGNGTLTDLRGNLFDGNADGAPGGDLVRLLAQGTILSAIDALLDSPDVFVAKQVPSSSAIAAATAAEQSSPTVTGRHARAVNSIVTITSHEHARHHAGRTEAADQAIASLFGSATRRRFGPSRMLDLEESS